MPRLLTRPVREELLNRGYSRRSFGRIAALMAGGASALPFYNEPALAQLSYVGKPAEGAVLINANENPLGPCPEALEAMAAALRRGGRYSFDETFRLAQVLAEQENVPASHVQAFAGSSDPLHRAVLAFASPNRPLVMGDPSFEAPERAARFIGARTVRVPLAPNYAHDVKAMLAAAPQGGVFYVCNPNNPTGTLTPRSEIDWLVSRMPAGSLLLLDEAYVHFAEIAPATDLVAAGKDVMVLRTFSKIYGMAGLRAGVAIARPDLLEKLRPYGTGFLPVTGMVGAIASLQSRNLVPERRKEFSGIRADLFSWMESKRYPFVPSHANCFMAHVRRPGGEVARAMATRNVYIGRVWPAWPEHVRITIGTRAEMERFRAAFAEVMG